jgi:hypothetical protein
VQREAGRFKDVVAEGRTAPEFSQPDWSDPALQAFAMLLDSTGLPPSQLEPDVGDSFLVLFNAGATPEWSSPCRRPSATRSGKSCWTPARTR